LPVFETAFGLNTLKKANIVTARLGFVGRMAPRRDAGGGPATAKTGCRTSTFSAPVNVRRNPRICRPTRALHRIH
jgi:hypothetical protein